MSAENDAAPKVPPRTLDVMQIMDALPHRFPFLFVDRVVEFVPMSLARGFKNLTINEPFFQGHFPEFPIMPGVIQIEALAQLGGIIIMPPDLFRTRKALLAGVEKARFRRPVVPGDRFDMEVRLLRARSNLGWVAASGSVEGEPVVSAELMFSIAPISDSEFRHHAAVLSL